MSSSLSIDLCLYDYIIIAINKARFASIEILDYCIDKIRDATVIEASKYFFDLLSFISIGFGHSNSHKVIIEAN